MEQEILSKAKLLLGIDGTEKDGLLLFVIGLIMDSIENYCNLDEIPTGLQNVAVAMAVDTWRQSQYGTEQLEGQARGVTRGDASFSFSTPAEQMQAVVQHPSFVQNYQQQLNQFRKMRF